MKKFLYSIALGLIAAAPVFADDTPIMDQPEGTLYSSMSRSGMGYYVYLNATLPDVVSGQTAKVVVNEEKGEIYIENPFSMLTSNTWLKGELDAEGNVVVHTPQFIYRNFSDTRVEDLYATRMVPGDIPGLYEFFKDEEESDLHFTWKDGVLTQTDNAVLGLTYIDGEFAGYADSDIKIVPFTDVNVAPENPDQLTFQNYMLGGSNFHELPQTKICKVAIDGNKVWIKNFYEGLPESYIHGEIVNGQLVLPSNQYLGIINDTYAYFFGASTYIDKNIFGVDENMYKLEEDLTMDSSEKDGFISQADFYINAGNTVSKRIEVYMQPELYPFDVTVARVPMTPMITRFNPIDAANDMYIGLFNAAIDPLDASGHFIDGDNLYYSMYLNDENNPLTLTRRDFPGIIKEDTTEIPVLFDETPKVSTWALLNYFNEITFIFDDASISRIGIRSIYKVGGQTSYSPIVWSDDPKDPIGVDEICVDETNAVYYDLSGRRVMNPEKGIYIVKLSNGKTFKKVVK